VLAILLVAGCASAQSIQEKGRQLVDEMIEALGGEQFLDVENTVEKGRVFSFYQSQVNGLSRATIYKNYLPLPDDPDPRTLHLRERQGFGDEERWYYLITEDDAWEVTYRGARPMAADTVERLHDNRMRDVFYTLLRRRNEDGIIFEERGTEVMNNRPTVKLDITDSENRVVTVWLHYSTKLPLRMSYQTRDENNVPHEDVVYYDKYNDAGGGVMLPMIIQRERDGERSFALFAESVSVNEQGLEEKWELPEGVSELERMR
jgi:hypothetical protein